MSSEEIEKLEDVAALLGNEGYRDIYCSSEKDTFWDARDLINHALRILESREWTKQLKTY